MCNNCKIGKMKRTRKPKYMKKATTRRRRRKVAKVGAITGQNMLIQAAGVVGAAVASSSDAIFQKIEFLKESGLKIAAAKGLTGWVLANNPTKTPQLNSPYLQEFGRGMLYYGWGQMTAIGLNMEQYVNKIGNLENPEQLTQAPSGNNFISNVANVDYYEMLAAEMEEGENAEVSGTAPLMV